MLAGKEGWAGGWECHCLQSGNTLSLEGFLTNNLISAGMVT